MGRLLIMWPANLEDFIKAMHGVCVVWKPTAGDDVCPF